MDILNSIKTALGSPTNKKEKSDKEINEKKDIFPGRFFDTKKNFSPEAQKSGAGIAYGELISRSSRIVTTNLICIVIIGMLVVKIAFLSNPVTIVTPPNMTEEVTLVGNKASESYKTQWAMFYSTMLGNINPKNIQFVMNYILDSLSPELQAKTGEALESQISIMQARGVDQTFRANDIYFDPKNDMVYVWGTKTTTLLNVPDKSESSKWTFEWVIGMKNGRPRIAHVSQYAGTPNIKKITVNGKEQLATLDNPPPSTGK